MIPRLVAAMLPLFALLGCAQTGSSMPAGPTRAMPQSHENVRARQALKYFDTPTQGAWPEYIIDGPQGALWFSEYDADRIGRITTGGQITEFSLPEGNDIDVITEGSDGNLWFTEPGSNAIGRMTPQGAFTIFPIAGGDDPSPRGITRGPDGNVWYVEYYAGYIGRVTPLGAITRFKIPDPSPYPWDITTGPDGSLWYTESADDAIGRFDPRKGAFKPSLAVPTQASTPWGILLARDKRVWFTERTGDKIAEVVGSTIREFTIAQRGSYPEKLAAGADGKLWFTESQCGDVGRLDPRTGKFGRLVALSTGSIPIGIASGPDKNLWIAISSYTSPSEIGKLSAR